MKLTLQEIASVVGAQNDVSLFEDLTINAIEFDSRQIKTGDLFLPLQGARAVSYTHLTLPTKA